jgi:hypothetical protein
MKLVVRSSKLPLFMSCPNSVLNPDGLLEVEREFEAAETGTLIHRLAEAYIQEGSDDIDFYADRLRMLDGYDRAHDLFPNIQRVWKMASKVFDQPQLEAYLEADIARDFRITGHIDVSEAFEDCAYVLDWKTGRVRDDHYHQMAGYAYLVWKNQFPAPLTHSDKDLEYVVHCTVCYCDDGSLYKYSFTGHQLVAWAIDVHNQAQRARYVYNKRCVYCPQNTECEGYKAKVTTAVATVTATDAVEKLRDMSDEDRADALQKLKIVESAVKEFRTAIKDDVRANGPMDTGDGREYVIKKTNKRNLNVAKALPVLNNHLTPEELYDVCTVSITGAENAVKRRAERGDKQKAADHLVTDLKRAKAIFTTSQERLEVRKKTKKLVK